MRKIIFGPMALAAVLGLAACDRSSGDAMDVTVIGAAPRLSDASTGPVAPTDAVLLASVAQGLVRFDARGQIEPGLAERWNVSDDGLSYIFRLSAGKWPDGRTILARDIARLLKRQVATASRNPLKDTLGAVDDIVAMTDRVIEIQLAAPRPNLLQLLAQPEMALVREGVGTGPFQIVGATDKRKQTAANAAIHLRRAIAENDGEAIAWENVQLHAMPVGAALAAFAAGTTDVVLGGSFDDLPSIKRGDLPRGALRFDPVAGLFGLVPVRADGPAADRDTRLLLSQAIDRDALIAALAVDGLTPRVTLLQAGLDGIGDMPQPGWLATPIADRRVALLGQARRLFGAAIQPVIRLSLPEGPGGTILYNRLAADWRAVGIAVERARPGTPADLALIDAVAPSTSPAWFVRRFHCGTAPICLPEADVLMDKARATTSAGERAQLLHDAGFLADQAQLFIPLAAPVRWSLTNRGATGFVANAFARHSLSGLGRKAERAD